MSKAVLALSFVSALVVVGCSSDTSTPAEDASLTIAEGCSPLFGGSACFLPYPSDFARKPDPSTRTGFRIDPPQGARFSTLAQKPGDVHGRHVLDGFSTVPALVAALPGSLSPKGLPGVNDDPAKSVEPSSPTVLVDAETGKLVPHYTDVILPKSESEDALRRPVVLRPSVKLKPRRRYVVAFRNVLTETGEKAAPAEGFRRLRDKTAKEPALVAIRDRYESEIFGTLEKSGISRSELQLAWDFTTGSDEAPQADMLAVRELTQAWLAANTPKIEVTSVEPRTGVSWKVVHGTVEGPVFVDVDAVGARLVRDASGAPKLRGLAKFPFSVHVPAALKTSCIKGRAIAYGHGFFGSQEEMTSSPATNIGNRLSAVTFGIDWIGFSAPDRDWLINILSSEPEKTVDFTDRVHQAMVNWMVLTHSVTKGRMDLPELSRPETGEGACAESGLAKAALFDSSAIHYFGPSLGGILGGVLGTVDPSLSRVALNVTGSGFSHMMPRAAPFGPLYALIHLVFGDNLVDQAFAASLQGALDRVDPAIWGSNMLTNKLPGSPDDRRVLLQVGLGDAAVPNLGAFLHARILGISQTSPAPVEVFGVPSAAPETLTSAMTSFDFGLGTNNPEAQPQPLNGVHDGLRASAEAQTQLDKFLTREGTIVHPCTGPCKLTAK